MTYLEFKVVQKFVSQSYLVIAVLQSSTGYFMLIYSQLYSIYSAIVYVHEGQCVCFVLNHWGRGMHICFSKLTIIGSHNGLFPDCNQAIIWKNAGILQIGPLGTNFSEILIENQIFSFKKMHLKIVICWSFCLGLNVLKHMSCWPQDNLILSAPMPIFEWNLLVSGGLPLQRANDAKLKLFVGFLNKLLI